MPLTDVTPDAAAAQVRLGILADTHGRADTCRAALQLLADAGAQAFAHCGDVGEEPVLDVLAGRLVWFVWGNNDLDRVNLARYASDLGLTCLDNLGRFDFAGRRFVLTHGDDPRQTQRICATAQAGQSPASCDRPDNYLLTGHTHVPHDRRFGELRWINPGALYRARKKTVALLDVSRDELRLLELKD